MFLALSTSAFAQNAHTTTKDSQITAPDSTAGVLPVDSLASLPEADTMLYLSPQRILADAAPRVLPEAHLAKLRSEIDNVKASSGIDLAKIDYVVVEIRFKKPPAELNFSLPEFIVVAGGDFSADSVLTLVRLAAEGKLRDEKYGSKTLSLFKIEGLAKEMEKNPFSAAVSELAIAPLNGNTIAAGSPAYVKDAIDAGEGKSRVSSDLVNSLLRNKNALISLAGSPLTAFSKSLGLLGTEANARAARCDTKLGDFYAAITLDSASFKLQGAMNADNPDTAKIIKSLLSNLLQQAESSLTNKSAKSALGNLTITPTENEVLLLAEISQQAVADFVREQMTPKPAPAPASPANTPVKKHRRTTQRRRTPAKT